MTGALLSGRLGPFGMPDPETPSRALEALDPAGLGACASRISAIAITLGSGAARGSHAVGEIGRGWSAPGPAIGVTRLLCCAEQTAGLLRFHSAAIDAVCADMRDAKTTAKLDFVLARAQLDQLDRTSVGDITSALLGAPGLSDDLQVIEIFRQLTDRLNGRLEAVEASVASLQWQLAGDPTAAPDGLRAGPARLLPPDPTSNPAVRTDTGNRAALTTDLQSDDPRRIRFAMSMLESLREAGRRGGTAQLVVYDSAAFDGQGRAAVSVGDLTTATNVAVIVPGITNSPSAMSGGIDLAADLRDEAHRQAPGQETAVVAWYGYDIPGSWTKDPGSSIATDVRDTIAVGSAANASTGAPVLAADLNAITAMSQTSARLTLLGFSMGATTVSEAARFDLPVDSVILLGAPGAGWDTDSAAGYRNIPASGVYIVSYDQDPVTLPVTDHLASDMSGIADPYGPDPAAQSFGGNHVDVSTNVPLLTGTGLLTALRRLLGDPRHHTMSNYMEGGALAAEGAVVDGRGKDVPVKRGR